MSSMMGLAAANPYAAGAGAAFGAYEGFKGARSAKRLKKAQIGQYQDLLKAENTRSVDRINSSDQRYQDAIDQTQPLYNSQLNRAKAQNQQIQKGGYMTDTLAGLGGLAKEDFGTDAYRNIGENFSLKGDDLTDYTNPYLQQVVDTTNSDAARNFQIQQAQQARVAAQRGSMGGSGSALLAAKSLGENNRNMATVDANLRSQAFENATARKKDEALTRMSGLAGMNNSITNKYNTLNGLYGTFNNISNNPAAIATKNAGNILNFQNSQASNEERLQDKMNQEYVTYDPNLSGLGGQKNSLFGGALAGGLQGLGAANTFMGQAPTSFPQTDVNGTQYRYNTPSSVVRGG